jgi:phthalate 4,5-dioxygenase oxygenase subunit
MQVERTPYGFRYAALRRPIKDAATHVYARCTVFAAPYTVLVPPNNLYNVANVNIPMDDTNTAFYFIAWGHPNTTPETQTWRKFLGNTVGIDLDERYRPYRNHENRFWQDRQAMRAGNFTGIKGFPNQDIAMWVTMGSIADRSRDRLGASDMAVVAFRQRMLDALAEFDSASTPIGSGASAPPAAVCSFQCVIPKEQDWREFAARPIWDVDQSAPRLAEAEGSYQVNAR